MNIINNPQPGEWAALCERNAPSDEQVIESVRAIVETVCKEGDKPCDALHTILIMLHSQT